jgi:hypothetical protein
MEDATCKRILKIEERNLQFEQETAELCEENARQKRHLLA